MIPYFIPDSTPVGSDPLLSTSSLFFHLDEVACRGQEDMLNDCENGGLGLRYCRAEMVICRGKFVISNKLDDSW